MEFLLLYSLLRIRVRKQAVSKVIVDKYPFILSRFLRDAPQFALCDFSSRDTIATMTVTIVIAATAIEFIFFVRCYSYDGN